MRSKTSLTLILLLATVGLCFSGYLSYNELFAPCSSDCAVVKVANGVAGIPACVYGFFMYLGIVVLALLGRH